MKLDLEFIIAESKKLGLELVSAIVPSFLDEDKERLINWQERGYAAGMSYMKRNPDLLCNPRAIFPEAATVLMFSLYYDRRPAPERPQGYGRVARYAWGRDYHKVIKRKLRELMEIFSRSLSGSLSYRLFTDSVPLLERALAKRAGLGFVGKNSMLIRPRKGSYFFIAEALINAEVVGAGRLRIIEESCGGCNNCKPACPTGAITADRVVDAGRCISYLTIEKRGLFSRQESEMIGEWIFGCDVCQEVCPFNHAPTKLSTAPAVAEFSAESGCGGLLNLAEVLSIRSDEEFIKRFSGTALMRAGRAGLLRNAASVAANTLSEVTVPALIEACSEDSSAAIRQACYSSLCKLNDKCNIIASSKMARLSENLESAA